MHIAYISMKILAAFFLGIIIFWIIQYAHLRWVFVPSLREPKMKDLHNNLYQLTFDILATLRAQTPEPKVWAIGGTMLGAARDGKIIPWDDDADFAYMTEDRAIIEAIDWASIGATVKVTLGVEWLGFQVHRNGVYVDLFEFENIEDQKVHYKGHGKLFWGKQFFLREEVTNLRMVPFGNSLIPVAHSYKPYLDRSFSAHWQTHGKIVPPHM